MTHTTTHHFAVGLVRGPDGKPIFDRNPKTMPAQLKAAYRRVMTESEYKEYFE